MTKKFFFLVAIIVFSISLSFHFIRLMFDWVVRINDWAVPSPVSGGVILFSVFMIYWSVMLGRKESSRDEEIGKPDEEEL